VDYFETPARWLSDHSAVSINNFAGHTTRAFLIGTLKSRQSAQSEKSVPPDKARLPVLPQFSDLPGSLRPG